MHDYIPTDAERYFTQLSHAVLTVCGWAGILVITAVTLHFLYRLFVWGIFS